MPKPALTYTDQLNLLESRGLTVRDPDFALHCLEHHNYYRLSAYRFPFAVQRNPDQFKAGIDFMQLWDLYHFDRTLRLFVIEAVKRVEISVRSRLAYVIGRELGPLAYLDNQHFSNPLIHAKTLTRLDGEMRRNGKEPFLKHHRYCRKEPWPPIWVLVEIASFGAISNMLSQLQPPKLRQQVANTYQMDEKTFCSLIHHLSVVRNTAAHHSRLWNRRFAVTFQLPKKKPANLYPNFYVHPNAVDQRESKIYNTLVLLLHLIRTIEPTSHWPERLINHISSFDSTLLPDMGFPTDWQTRPIWKKGGAA
jgi:abortive infection bacteriophage resistance protein